MREYLSLNDKIIEVDLTPNRSDCLSIKGLAREVGVLNRVPVEKLSIEPIAPVTDDVLGVALDAGEACPRYLGRVIRSVDVSRPSPLWLQEKLRRSGVRPIDAVVDVTNYILLELGQPMHAFDLSKLSGGIVVRMAKEGEKLTLLDGQELTLTDGSLLIADQEKALALAGVMGGEESAVSENTRDIFLESAFFNPVAIAGKARSYGLHTDSSHRFERGVDYNGAQDAIERATSLLLDIVGGEAGPVICAEKQEALPKDKSVKLRRESIELGLGFAIPDGDVEAILTGLGLVLDAQEADGWVFSVPSYRFDISIEADLLEELARIYGYNRLPTTDLKMSISLPSKTEKKTPVAQLLQTLAAKDYQEVITYSFIDPKLQSLFGGQQEAVTLMNPISADMSTMRTSLLPGLVQTLTHNLKSSKITCTYF